MRLTRRDAAVALALAGAGAVGAGRLVETLDDATFVDEVAALAAVAYPSEVDSHGEFVETYLAGRMKQRREEYEYVTGALSALDRRAMRLYSRSFTDLSVDRRDAVLRDMGVDAANASPDGTVPERVRYLLDDLLFALYASPAGGTLVGNENPIGYPGGLEPYQREP